MADPSSDVILDGPPTKRARLTPPNSSTSVHEILEELPDTIYNTHPRSSENGLGQRSCSPDKNVHLTKLLQNNESKGSCPSGSVMVQSLPNSISNVSIGEAAQIPPVGNIGAMGPAVNASSVDVSLANASFAGNADVMLPPAANMGPPLSIASSNVSSGPFSMANAIPSSSTPSMLSLNLQQNVPASTISFVNGPNGSQVNKPGPPTPPMNRMTRPPRGNLLINSLTGQYGGIAQQHNPSQVAAPGQQLRPIGSAPQQIASLHMNVSSFNIGGNANMPSTNQLGGIQVPANSVLGHGTAGASSTDPEKRKLIQQQLVLLLHAHKCQKREQTNGESLRCNLPHCHTMKRVLNHMTSCMRGRACTEPHCASSRQIIAHWKHCNREDCPVCLPLKSSAESKKVTAPVGANSGQLSIPAQHSPLDIGGETKNPSMVPHGMVSVGNIRPMQTIGLPGTTGAGGDIRHGQAPQGLRVAPMPPPQVAAEGVVGIKADTKRGSKEWHSNVNQDLRNHLVQKLVQAIFPARDPNTLRDPRMNNLVQYAKKVEADMFDTANSREQYYHLLAEKIYKIQKELEEKRQERISKGTAKTSPAPAPLVTQQPRTIGNMFSPGSTAPPAAGLKAGASETDPVTAQASAGLTSNTNFATGNTTVPRLPTPVLSSADLPETQIGTAGSANGVPMAQALRESQQQLREALKKLEQQQASHSTGVSATIPPSVGNEMEIETKPSAEAINLGGDVPAEVKSEPIETKEVKPEPVDGDSDMKPAVDIKPGETKPGASSVIGQVAMRPPKNKKMFSPEEMRTALMPIVEIVSKHEEAQPFRDPVDPIALGIPDYFSIVKTPMDLATIRKKLDTGAYKDPWEFVDDIYLMLDNAWIYNRKNSRVHRSATKAAELFESLIDKPMQNLGFCCGKRYVFNPNVLMCFGGQLCTIHRDAVYYSYENGRFVYCEKCFNDIQEGEFDVQESMEDGQPPVRVKKASFEKTKKKKVPTATLR